MRGIVFITRGRLRLAFVPTSIEEDIEVKAETEEVDVKEEEEEEEEEEEVPLVEEADDEVLDVVVEEVVDLGRSLFG